MKVAFDHQIFFAQRYGGISRYFVELAKNIPLVNARENSVKLISPIYVNEYLKSAAGELQVQGKHVPQIPYTGGLIRSANECISHIMLKYFDPDIVHETYYSHKNSAPKNARRIVTVYDMIHELLPGQFSSRDKTREAKRVSVSRADHVICISENTRQDLIHLLGVNPENTSVVHLGFYLSSGNQQFPGGSDRPYLLYVGSRGGYKNFFGFIEAYAQSPMVSGEFDVVAFGGGAFSADEKSLLQELKIPTGKVTQVSGSDEMLEVFYRGADLFVYPSLYEGFGIPPLEAMSYGCPVACSNTGSIPEVVGDAALFFDPYSKDSIIDSLEIALSEPKVKEALIQKGLDRIQKFSWSKCAKETLSVYEKALQ